MQSQETRTMHTPAAPRDPIPHIGGGTPGGKPGFTIRPGGKPLAVGDAGYLWVMVALEVLAIAWLRTAFRRRHGG